MVAVVLVALVIVCVIAGIWMITHSQGASVDRPESQTAGLSVTAASNSQQSAQQSKLAGAEETVDNNGIVHGTTPDGINYVVYGRGKSSANPGVISLAAVGDVFATNMNFPILAEYGERSGVDYDFKPYYQAVADEINGYDLRFINQETPCAGNGNGYEYSGYPVFNTPDSSIHAIADVGFNIANFNSNHTWDMGSFGIERSHELFAQHPEVMVIGSYLSQSDRDTVHMIERDGATIALLSYSYGDNFNGEDPDNFPNKYYTCQFDKSVMQEEIERAQKVADAVVVYMHWGTEYTTEPNEQQLEYAQFL
ncbi:MAG: CapA family protein, partial [Eggerthellaceae bacterium]|nr:CapA family protein [Eggerthellaceae bacterium]